MPPEAMQPLLLDLRHYETVVAIIEHETMTAAATHLATSQSALSHRLADAERRLGTALFERGRNRRLQPTRHGLAVHQAATRVFDELRRVESTVRASPSRHHTTLRIAVGSYDCYHWFPGFVDRVHTHLDDIDLELVVVGDHPAAALGSDRVDVVLAPGHPEGNVELTPLFDDELVLVTSPDHPLAGRDQIVADDLVPERLLTYSTQPSPGFEYDLFLRPSGVYPHIVQVVSQTSAIVELVAAGAGVSIMSRWALDPNLRSGRVVGVRCGDGLAMPWHAATRRGDDRTTSVVAELIAFLSDPVRSSA